MTTEVDRQLARVQHLIVRTGIHPTVLDVDAATMHQMVEELLGDRRYPAPKRTNPEEARRLLRNGFDLFGVRFVKGV